MTPGQCSTARAYRVHGAATDAGEEPRLPERELEALTSVTGGVKEMSERDARLA